MKQYKFRSKRKDNGEWVYGDLITKPVHHECVILENGVINHSVDPVTVGMWTGLKDKNGKEIYEGDILKSFNFSVPSYEVFNDRGCYRLRYKLRSGDWYDWGPLFRMEEIQWEGRLPLCPDVIGNIHEHAHLLNPAKGAVTNTMNNLDPNTQAAPANQEAIAEQATTDQVAAVEQEAQEQAMESEG